MVGVSLMGCSDSYCDLSEYHVAVVGIIPIPPKRLSGRVAGDIQTGRKHYRNDRHLVRECGYAYRQNFGSTLALAVYL